MKKPKPPSIVTIAVMTLITVVFWTFFSVYRVFTSKSPVDVPEEVLKPINPTLDQNALTILEERYYLEEGQIPTITYSTPIPTPTPETEVAAPDNEAYLTEPGTEYEEQTSPETSPTPTPQDTGQPGAV